MKGTRLPLITALLLTALVTLKFTASGGSADLPLIPETLAQKAWTQGKVRVIVRLGVNAIAEGLLPTDAEVTVQRGDIASAQSVVRSGLRGVGHRVLHQYASIPFMALEVDPHGLRMLESLRGSVTQVAEDRLHYPALAESGPLVQAGQAWTAGFDGTGTVVAVIDTGVHKFHPFLAGKVVEEACYSSNNPPYWTSTCPGGVESSVAPGSGAPCDLSIEGCEHGTHVAGIAAGDGAAGAVAAFSGAARGADIMAVQVFTRSDYYCWPSCIGAFESDIIAGLHRVYQVRSNHHFAAANLSLGGDPFWSNCDGEPMKSIIDTLRSVGIATVVAAGNDGYLGAISTPACISTAVSVGSTDDGSGGTTADQVSFFSNSASFLSLLAPGQWINSSIPPSGFANFQGTSMAAPHVTGAFAVLKQAAPTATVPQILDALKTTGLPVLDARNGLTKPRIRIADALAQLPQAQFDAAGYSVNESAGTATIRVTRTGVATGRLTVQYATSNGTATSGLDYTAVSGTLTFLPGETSKAFTIPIVNDTLDEPDETVNLGLSNPVGGRLGPQSTATLTIADDDVAGSVQLSSAAYGVSESAGSVTVTVTRTGGAASGVTVAYATADGTATAPGDYTAKSGTLTFGAGETTKTFTIPIANDTIEEGEETVNLTLSNPTGGAVLGVPSTAVLTIRDNDEGGAIEFTSANYAVSEAGPSAAITVRRTGGAASGVTVQYATSDGTARAGTDYTSTSGTLTFGAGVASQTFLIPIINDTIKEGDKTVLLKLSTPTGGATLGTQQTAVLTIRENDAGGVLQFGAATYSVTEGGIGSLVVTRTGTNLAGGVTVDYAVVGGTATGGGVDYTLAAGALTFAAGQTSRTISVPTVQDTLAEGAETVVVRLSNPTGGAALGLRIQTTLSILDNDAGGVVQFGAAASGVGEGAGTATIRVVRTGTNLASDVMVDYAVVGGTATGGGVDYTLAAGTLTFAAGQATATIEVAITDDTLAEGNETVIVALSNPRGRATLGAQRTTVLTIVDDEVGLRFSAPTYTVSESGGLATITVVRTGPPAPVVSVSYATSALTATAGGDYRDVSGVLTFAAGVTVRTFTVPIVNDNTLVEGAETVQLTLSGPSAGAQVGTPSTAVLTIVEDDRGGSIRFGAARYTVAEGGVATVTVTRTGGLAGGVAVDYAMTGTATGGGVDYTLAAGTLTFAAGQTSRSLTIPTVGDLLAEGNEKIVLTLSNAQGGATLGVPSTTEVIIVDNDLGGTLQFGAAAYSVGENALAATVTVTWTGGTASGVTVQYATSDGTALADVDYTAVIGALTFGPGLATTQSFQVPILDNGVADGNRTVNLSLSSPTGGAILGAVPTAVLWIVDDE